ncbi:hypothetical protein [Peribacillus simplex]|uniref:Uncharacterized protein n=1 Tax=Peribacillus simplex TaxID=1478 RepID=A0A9W4L8X1_9BACI|nr:hypothetical protein [Peribacillus simplex]WHX93287.1 hypothetical protein QNH50_10885 [Peribacillus simplex]CAH0314531.1 hypothetical protein SRABI133_05080 [Peribacillus simplex]
MGIHHPFEKWIKMFEFTSEKEAREKIEVIEGCIILSEVIYFNDKQLIES